MIPLREKGWMFKENEYIINSPSIPHAKLHKQHISLSFHKIREAITAGFMSFRLLADNDNPSNILSKNWGYQKKWELLQPILFWRGNNIDIISSLDNIGSKDDKYYTKYYLNINGEGQHMGSNIKEKKY